MRLQSDGAPIVQTRADEMVMDLFISKLVGTIYNRLPRMVKLLVSRSKFVRIIREGVLLLADRNG